MCYLVYDYKGKKRYFYSPAKIFDIILALGVAAVAIYILRDIDAFLLRMDLVASPTDIVMGAICTVIVPVPQPSSSISPLRTPYSRKSPLRYSAHRS